MKKSLTLLFVFITVIAISQPRIVRQAVFTTKVTILSDVKKRDTTKALSNQLPKGVKEGIIITTSGGDKSSTNETTVKGDLVKIFTKDAHYTNTIYRNNAEKRTVEINNSDGFKSGYYSNDDEASLSFKKRREKYFADKTNKIDSGNFIISSFINYYDESKVVADTKCKKAYVVMNHRNGVVDSFEVWYCPEFKMQNIIIPGEIFEDFVVEETQPNYLSALKSLQGFPMQFEYEMDKTYTKRISVLKIDLDKKVSDKEFEMPKNVKLSNKTDLTESLGL